jgi:hypothetical protein
MICVFSEQDVDVNILAPKFVSPTLECSPSQELRTSALLGGSSFQTANSLIKTYLCDKHAG